ncbi:MAG: hypothetical protein BGO52_00600 [Sphingobacteriales bacterium 44-61]|uniref:hypothetical protein n=1 Tax=uncultured Dysgonomonas sp. TaxID=206096 RepID=UPI0009692CA6|nr:hypothetical protein [uncultured Dysgonomonas sp.]OJW02647.1 MAG: hypothetical protein BGO52_00600 [Sphingobacteriales bacterium 44-61]
MKLVELVNYFRSGGAYEDFCQSQSLNTESEVIEIYMEKPFNLDNSLAFFEIEKTEGKNEYILNGVKYFNLIDFYYFLDSIEESNIDENASLTDNEIAKKIYDYAINDA